MRHLPVRGPCLALLAAVTIAGRARAQVSIEVAPLAGLYASMNDFPAPSSFFPTGPDRWKQATGLTYGGQGTLWLGPVGVVASYSRANSNVEVQAGSTDTTLDASLTIATAQVIVGIRPGDWDNRIYFSAGLGRVERQGKAYQGIEHLRSTGAALGFGTRLELSSRLGVDIGLQSLIYKVHLGRGGTSFGQATEVDLVGRAGVILRII